MTKRKVKVEDLVQRGVALAREYGRQETTKTEILKALAIVVVELRQRFENDGRTDWAGRSYTYRETVARIYHESGLPPDSVSNLQSALRYHIGNALREVAPPEELADLGLKSARPIDAAKTERDRQAALARAGAALEAAGRTRDVRLIRLISQAEVLVTRIAEARIEDLEPDVVEGMVASLEVIARSAQSVLRELEPHRRRRRGGRRRLASVADAV